MTDGTKPKRKKCLCCPRESWKRGLCTACYQMARRSVLNGETTWAKLVEAKLARESIQGQRPGREPNGFKVKLKATKAK